MKCLFSALARAICLFVAVALLHGCGGGDQPEQEPTSKSTALQDVWVKAEDGTDSLIDQEIEDELKAQGFRVVRQEVVAGRTAFLLQVRPGEIEQLARVIKPLGWIISAAASQELRVAHTSADMGGTIPTLPAFATKASRIKATLKYRVFPNPTQGQNICFDARVIPPEFNSHQEAYQDCNRIATQQSGGYTSLGALTAIAGKTVDGQPERMSAPGRFKITLADTQWNQFPYVQVIGFSRAVCPAGSTLTAETTLVNGVSNTNYWCETEAETPEKQPPETKNDTSEAGMCTSNPIIPASGEKILSKNDVEDQAPHPLNFTRQFRTQWQIGPQARMGQLWAHNHSANLRRAATDATGNTLILQLADGSQRRFTRASATAAWTNTSHAAQLTAATTTAGAPAWRYTSAEDNSQWLFTQPTATAIGLLQSTRQRNGWTYVYAYNAAGQLTQVTNHFGRTLRLTYHATSGLLASVIQPDTRTTQYTWDASNRLTRVTHPDGRFVTHHHENTSFPQLITGITDENGLRYSTYTYDAQGRATRSTLGANIDTYTVAYSGTQPGFNTTATITDPIGTARSYGYAQTNGHTNVISGSNLPGCKGEPPIATRIQNPTTGLLEQETDFKGNVTQYSWNTARMLPQSVTRGYATPLAQTTTTTWHPTFALPERITEPLRQTRFVYDTAGRLLSQTVTHTGGASNGKVQTTRYTYNAQGLLATRTEPNNAVTTFDQYSAAGLPQRISNPLGHITTLTYDGMGRPTQITQADGLVRTLAYDPRGRVLSSSAAASGTTLTTTYTYTPSGQVKTATMPDGHAITYSHDIAQRVTGWSDNRGQSATYTLDGLGNITNELTRSSGGATALQIARSITNINRLASQTLGAGVTSTYGYDANGQLLSVTDAANRSTRFTLDALQRVNRITDALGRAASLAYDSADAVTSATDFKSVRTTYSRDADGKAGAEQTPDAGSTASTYDALGLPTRVVDALARASAITRDNLGRPTLITHSPASGTPATTPGGKTLTTQLRYDLTGTTCNATNQPNASKGRLCEMIDKVDGVLHATTQYQWDAFGRQTAQTQTLSSAIANHSTTRTTRFAYVVSGPGAGELATLTYPSGSVLTYQYSAAGRLTGLLWGGQPLIETITYNALSQPLSWRWAFADASTTTSLPAARLYNTAGQLTSAEFASFTPDATARIGAISHKLMRSNGSGGWVSETVPLNALYDATGRLLSLRAQGSTPALQWSHAYTFDANGNRASAAITQAGITSNLSYSTASGSNRLSAAAGSAVVTNAAGEITSLLATTMAYDSAGRLAQVTGAAQTTTHRFNGQHQRYLRESSVEQSVFSYAPDGFSLLSHTSRNLSTSQLSTTEHIWLPTASGPMPIAAVIDGVNYAVHADHLNTPRRLTDKNGLVKWQWAYSGSGEIAPQSTPATGQAPIGYALRYPGQVDDGNGLFYNWNRFYHPATGRYTKADPIGLDGGWNRFAYVGGNAFSYTDPTGLRSLRSGSSRQRRLDRREEAREARIEAQRVANYYQQQAERDAWVNNFTRNNRDWGNYGDGFGALTGGGIAGHHPSVPNSLEPLLDPNRRNNNDPFVPGIEAPPEYPHNICPRR